MRRRIYAVLSASVLASAVMAVPAYAAASKDKIKSVTLTVTDRLQLGSGVDEEEELEIDTSADDYSVSEWEIMNESMVWGTEDVPEVEVILVTEDDYSFSVTKDKVKIKGSEATVVSVKKEDSQELHITLSLKPMSERVGAIEAALLDGTVASWTPALGALSYDIYLFRDNKAVGSKKTTAETTYDFGAAMNKEGEYYFKVRAVGKEGAKDSQFAESQSHYRTAAEIAAYVAGSADTQSQAAASGQDGAGASDAASQGTLGKWVPEGERWRFFKEDGSQQYNDWLFIQGKWYFFEESGLMKTGWVAWKEQQYYLGPDGDMWVNRETPDGHFVNENGVAVR